MAAIISAEEVRRRYNQGGESFERFNNTPSHKIGLRTVMSLLGDLRGRAILDMGCGQGVFIAEMAARGAAHITGADISETMLRLAREKTAKYAVPAGGCEIELLQSDISWLGVLGRFDKILAVFSFIYA